MKFPMPITLILLKNETFIVFYYIDIILTQKPKPNQHIIDKRILKYTTQMHQSAVLYYE